MEKKYISNSIIAISGKVDKRTICVEFIHTSKGTSYYITSDRAIQRIIEECEYYKKGFIKSEELGVEADRTNGVKADEPNVANIGSEGSDSTKTAETTERDVTEYSEVTKCVEAMTLLRERYGVTVPLTSKIKIHEMAKELGISFPNL